MKEDTLGIYKEVKDGSKAGCGVSIIYILLCFLLPLFGVDPYTRYIIAAQQIAVDLINNDTSILPNHHLSFHILNSSESTANALIEVLGITAKTTLVAAGWLQQTVASQGVHSMEGMIWNNQDDAL